jgi:hypothetical protein
MLGPGIENCAAPAALALEKQRPVKRTPELVATAPIESSTGLAPPEASDATKDCSADDVANAPPVAEL